MSIDSLSLRFLAVRELVCLDAALSYYKRRVSIVTEIPVRLKYACARSLLRMPDSKKKAYYILACSHCTFNAHSIRFNSIAGVG